MIDCTRNHFGSDILRAKSLFSKRWEIRKQLGTIIKGGIAWKIHRKEVSFISRCCQDHWAIKKSIIGLGIFDDSLTMITSITKQFLIFRSRIPMALMEIMVADEWQWHKVWITVRSGALPETLSYVAVNTDLDPLSYLRSSIGGIMLKDIPKMLPQPIPVHLALSVNRMIVRMHICWLQTSHQHWLPYGQIFPKEMRSNSAKFRIRTKE